MARILVSGAAGFVPSYVCSLLLERGDEVIGIDSLITGQRSNLELCEKGNFTFIEGDVSQELPELGKIEGIFHLASPASPVDFASKQVEILDANILGSRRLLDLAYKNKAKYLFASSSEVYGDPLIHPQKESYWGNVSSTGARSCYDEGKRAGEALSLAWHRNRGVDTKLVRIFNTHGPRMRLDDGRVVPNFGVQALSDAPLTVHGTGEQTRSLCFVSDLAKGIIRVFDQGDEMPYNVGSDTEITVMDLAQMIIRLSNSKSPIVRVKANADDPQKRRPDLTRIRALGWKNEVELEEGLNKTLNYFREKLKP